VQILHVGNSVFLLRFLPDGSRLVVGTAAADWRVTFEVLSLPDGRRVRLEVPRADLHSWFYHARYGNAIAVHPSGESCYIAWAGDLHAFRTEDGRPLPVSAHVLWAHQVVLSPAGDRLVTAYLADSRRQLFAVAMGPDGAAVLWQKGVPTTFSQVAGFLPDGERFVTLDGAVRIRSFATGEELAAGRVKPVGTHQPQLSPDGRQLAAIGYGSMYFFDLVGLGKPRKIRGSSNYGDFRSFAFAPDGRTVAVIHGGPTLVKVYDLGTLERLQTYNWMLGPLRSVAYSPDGSLGAAGSDDGRVVVWDAGA
jgi:WD40 repeat protein